MQNSASTRRLSPSPFTARSALWQGLRYINRFGVRGGLQAARALGRSTEPVAVRLPELPHPLWIRPGTSDVATFQEVFVAREYDLPLRDFAPRHVLDLGANVGFASVLFAARWPEASILAVEPVRENVELLKRNTGAYANIRAIRAAVWSRPAEVAIENPTDAANAFRMSEEIDGREERIPACTIAQLITRLGCAQVDLLKMDVEGAEAEIFRGPRDWIDCVQVMMVELHDRIVPGCAEALYAALRGRRFKQEIVGQNLLIDLRGS